MNLISLKLEDQPDSQVRCGMQGGSTAGQWRACLSGRSVWWALYIGKLAVEESHVASPGRAYIDSVLIACM